MMPHYVNWKTVDVDGIETPHSEGFLTLDEAKEFGMKKKDEENVIFVEIA